MATYERINWENLPSQDTPLDADNLNHMDAAIDAINRELGNVSDRVALNASRISEFTALESGSTTGDAELIDGRIGSDGTVYNNIGDAIRSQVESLAQGITENQNGIFAINDRITYNTSVLADSTRVYPNKEMVLAALDSYATNMGDNGRYTGYISTANSNVLGLTNTSHYFDFYVNSPNYRILVARPVNGNTIYQLAKQNGTWATTWKQISSLDDTVIKHSYMASADNIEDIYQTGIYFIGNNVRGKPLGTTGTGTNGILIVGGYETRDSNIVKLYIYASQTTTEKRGMYLRTFAGTLDYGWIKVPDDLIDREVKKLIIPQAEINDMPVNAVAMPTLAYHAKIQQTTGVSGAKTAIFKNDKYFCVTYGENLDGNSGDYPKVTTSGVLAMKYKFFKFENETESNVSYGTIAQKGSSYIDYTGATKTFAGGCGLPSGSNGKQFFSAAHTGTNRYNGFDNYGMTPCCCSVSVSSSGVTFGDIYELTLSVGGESGKFDLTRIDSENVNYNLYLTTAPPSYSDGSWHWVQPGKHSLIYMTSTDAINWTYQFSIPTDFDPCCEVPTVVYNGYILAAVRTWGSSSNKYITSTLYLMLISTSGFIVHQYRIPNVSTRSYLVNSGDDVLLFFNPYNKTTSECIRITSESGAIENGLYFHRWFTIHKKGSWYITCNEDTVSSSEFTDMYIAGGNDAGPSTANGMEFMHLKFDASSAHDPKNIDVSVMNDTLLARVSKLQQNVSWSSSDAVKITTSITDYVTAHGLGVYYIWSARAAAATVGAPSEDSYHYLVIKVNSATALIQAHRMTTGADVFYVKQLYGGNWGSSWTQIANQSALENLNGTQSEGVSNTNFNSLITAGSYQVGDLSTMTNAPSSTGYGILEVVRARSYILQKFYSLAQTGITTYVRHSTDTGSTWKAWATL